MRAEERESAKGGLGCMPLTGGIFPDAQDVCGEMPGQKKGATLSLSYSFGKALVKPGIKNK